ncbi:MAG: hypothetical protein IT364_28055 [Candidatus Hydrogenedentes bacterium]|nr:hypothetical protein [Candidatus Hydrogenedentota bacterium]
MRIFQFSHSAPGITLESGATSRPAAALARRCRAAALVLLGLACAACVRQGRQLETNPLPPDTPEISTILQDLASNDAAFQNFRAAISLTLESPKLTGIQQFDGGYVAFRKPDSLCVQGTMKPLGTIAFRLTSAGREYLIEFPTKRDDERYYYQLEGEQFENVPFNVYPSDIAREMFTPEDWDSINPRHARIIAYDSTAQEATLLIGPARRPERRIVVRGAPWVIVENERLSEDGITLALSTFADYQVVNGVRFPSKIDVTFPTESTRMTFEMRNIRVNTDQVNDTLFTINWRPKNDHAAHSTESR